MTKLKYIFCFILTLWSFSNFAQNTGNPHFFKLIVENDEKEILLIKYEGAWEVPGSRYKDDETLITFVKNMGQKHGIMIGDVRLKALVTFHHEVRTKPTMMFYFKAKYQSGKLSVPTWGEDLAWFSLEKAYKLIPFPEMNYIIQNIKKKDILQGAFRITYDTKTKTRKGFEIIEDLKKIN